MEQIRKRLTYANVMSSIAVFVALGTTAIAATQLPKNSVGTKQLRKNAVTAAKIKKNAITGAKILNGSLRGADFAAGQLPAGPKGETGAKGEVGPTFGRSGGGGHCNPNSTAFLTCASTGAIELPASGRVLLIGTSAWDNNDSAPPNSGTCHLEADDDPVGPFDPTYEVDVGEATATHSIGKSGTVAITAISGVLPAGGHTFSLKCNETETDVYFTESMISAVLLGPS